MEKDFERERLSLLRTIEDVIDPRLLKTLSILQIPPQPQHIVEVVITTEGTLYASS